MTYSQFLKPVSLTAFTAFIAMATAFAQQRASSHPTDNYALKLEPTVYQTHSQNVVVVEASERQQIVPAVFKTIEDAIVVSEARCPGDKVIKTTQVFVVSESHEIIRTIPAVYETVTERVLKETGKSGWVANSDGSFSFQKTEPVYQNIVKSIQKMPESFYRITVPQQIAQYTIQRVAEPRQLCTAQQQIPQQIRKIQRKVVVSPATVRRIAIPAKSSTQQVRVPLQNQSVTLSQLSSDPTSMSNVRQIRAGVNEVMPAKPNTELLYRPEIENEECVLWKSFTNGDVDVEPGRFPWPPPDPSYQSTMSAELFRGVKTLGEMDTLLRKALDEIGIRDFHRRYYPIPNGFTLVTKLEKIDDNGVPTADRWSEDIFNIDPPSIANWFQALLTARKGRFRVIAIAVTSDDVNTDGNLGTRDDAKNWLNSGLSALSAFRAGCEFGTKHRVTVLVYEFEHVEQREPLLVSGTSIDHLDGSGLREQLTLTGTQR